MSAIWTYTSVVLILLCPNSSWTIFKSVPCSIRWVANECRNRCRDTPVLLFRLREQFLSTFSTRYFLKTALPFPVQTAMFPDCTFPYIRIACRQAASTTAYICLSYLSLVARESKSVTHLYHPVSDLTIHLSEARLNTVLSTYNKSVYQPKRLQEMILSLLYSARPATFSPFLPCAPYSNGVLAPIPFHSRTLWHWCVGFCWQEEICFFSIR